MGLVIGVVPRFRLAQQPDPTEVLDDHPELHHLRGHDRNGNATSAGIHDVAQVVAALAGRHLLLPAEELTRLRVMTSRLAPPKRTGLTAKNRGRLLPLRDPGTLRKLACLPDTLWERAGTGSTRRGTVDRETAVAIAILLSCPIRVANLFAIHLERHLQRGSVNTVFLRFEAEEVKNRRPIEFELPRRLALMIDQWLDVRSFEFIPAGTPWLFPRRDGAGPVSPTVLSRRISSCIRRELGLEVHAHLFRHLAAMVLLSARPGSYEAVRRLLGHSDLSQTLDAYAGFEADSATRMFADLVEEVRRR